MRSFFGILLVLLVVTLTSCSTVKVVTDVDKSVDFSKYKTYNFLGWQEGSDKLVSDLDKKRLRDAFISEFESRGMKPVKENGDLAISLFIVIDQKTTTTAYTNYYGGGYGGYHRYRGGWGYGSASTTYSESDYLEGTLVLDAFDGKTKDQVWQAVATKTVNENPQKRETSIPKNIAALMKEFPIQPME